MVDIITAGTVTFTNGSKIVTGVGTGWGSIQPGDLIDSPVGSRIIQSMDSATQLTLATNYPGATAAAQAYAIVPASERWGTNLVLAQKIVTLIELLTDAPAWESFAALVPAASKIPYFNSSSTAALASITSSGLALLDGTMPMGGFRNKIINGDVPFWQRGTSITVAAGATVYGPDRWSVYNSTNQSCVVSRVAFANGITTVPTEPEYLMAFTFAVAPTSGNVVVRQPIESAKTLTRKTATATLYFQRSATDGGQDLYLEQVFGTGGSTTVSIAGTGTWTSSASGLVKVQKVFSVPTISGKTLGTRHHLGFGFVFTPRAIGSSYISHLSLVEGDATGEADPFSPRHIQQELALCRRYYRKSFDLETTPAQSAGTVQATTVTQAVGAGTAQAGNLIQFGDPMAATPTVIGYNPSAANALVRNSTVGADAAATTFFPRTTGIVFSFTSAAGSVAGNNNQIHWTADAEF